MSHFSVLVATNIQPSGDPAGGVLAGALHPYDENNNDARVGHWDWWQLGGRWRGMLLPKPGKRGVMGQPGAGDRMVPGGYDALQVQDIDREGALAIALREAKESFDEVEAYLAGKDQWRLLLNLLADDPTGSRLDEFWAHPIIKGFPSRLGSPYVLLQTAALGWERCAEDLRRDAMGIGTFAYIDLAGDWHERGEMGMFGASRDHIGKVEWRAQQRAFVESLPDGTWLSVVDCHC